MTVYCSECGDIPANYTNYKGKILCTPCLWKRFLEKMKELNEEFPFFEITEGVQELKHQKDENDR